VDVSGLAGLPRTAQSLALCDVHDGAGDHEGPMVESIALILLVVWLLGMTTGYTLGGFIYVVLLIAIVLILVRLIEGPTQI
jgi:hypothetical protein